MSKQIYELRLLGNPQILLNNELMQSLTSVKSQALLYYLATKQSSLSRVTLAGLLWADKSDEEARVNLRQALRQIVKALPDAVLSSRETLMINGALVASDLQHFEKLSTASDIALLKEAADLYRGDFLEGFFVENALEFEDWQLLEQERLRLIILNTLEALRRHFVEQHALEDALKYTSRFLSIEPFHEESQRAAMRLLSLQGSYRLALQQYTTYHSQLQRELGIQPSLETITLYQRIKRLSLVSLPELPSEVSPLVGRETELKEVTELLTTNNRLVTLLGSGGVGKTRFALAVTKQLERYFLEGVFWVELAGLSSESFVAASIASSLGIQLSGNQPANEQLIEFLKDKELLLVLDNFEHLLATNEAVDLVQQIWQEVPNVTLLVTSRIRLNLRAEYTYLIDQLAFPDMEQVKFEKITSYESVTLFRQVGKRVGKNLKDNQDILLVGKICQLLEGMPLAIEMVASLAIEVPLTRIQTTISENLTDLSTSMRDVPQRQRSLQATFNYSLDLLSQEERMLLFKLSVFRGGFNLEAAEHIAKGGHELLTKLLAHSLIKQDETNRYSVHEVVRQLAQAELEKQDGSQEVNKRHRQFFAKKIELVKAKLSQSGAQQVLDWLTLELSNIQLAWKSASNTLDTQTLNQILDTIKNYYTKLGPPSVGLSLFSPARNSVLDYQQQQGKSKETDLLLARLMLVEAGFEASLANYEQFEDLTRAAIKKIESYNEPNLLASSLDDLCRGLNNQQRYQESLPISLRAVETVPESDVGVSIKCLITLAISFRRVGKMAEAEDALQKANSLTQKQKNLDWESSVTFALVNFHKAQGHIREAIKYGHATIQLTEELGDQAGMADCLGNIGIALDLIGNYTQSRQFYRKSLDIQQRIGRQMRIMMSFTNLGRVEHFLGNYEVAYTNYKMVQAYYQNKSSNNLMIVTANLALLAHNQKDQKTAITLSSEAITLAEKIKFDYFAQFGYLFKGHAEHALNHLQDALQSYQKVIDICQKIKNRAQEIEALAGQACVLLDQQDLKQAMVKIEPVLTFLKENPEADGTEEPLRLYLSSYKVLAACGDERAKAILEAGHKVLMGRAEKLEDEALKESYLNNVLVHKELITLYGEDVTLL